MKTENYVASSSLIERIGHWTLAGTLIVLFFTGCGFLFSSLRRLQILFGGARGASFIHHVAGIFFSASLVICFFVWIKDCWPNREDLNWLKRGRYFSRLAEPSKGGKFNTSQKIFFFEVIFFGFLAFLSGWALWNPQSRSPELLVWYYALHTLCATFFGITGILHVYMRIFVNPGSLEGITFGRVSRTWAKHYRSKWLEKIEKQREDY